MQVYLTNHGLQRSNSQELFLETETILSTIDQLPDQIKIKPWNIDYLYKVARLITQVMGNSVEGKNFPHLKNITGALDFINDILQHRFGKFENQNGKVVMLGTRIIGYCFFTQHTDTQMYIPLLGIDAPLQDTATALSFFSTVIKDINETNSNIDQMILHVSDNNDKARKFYHRLGFVPSQNNYFR